MNSLNPSTIPFRSVLQVSNADTLAVKSSWLDREMPLGGYLKRAFDISFALFGLIASLPFFALTALAVRTASPGPVFYRHERIGYGGETFACTKFRTMVMDADAQLARHLESCPKAAAEFRIYQKLRKDPRIIPFVGTFLRKSSLDELPQLIDVLAGRMSLVGPRPVTLEEVEMYGPVVHLYFATRPGITGLWQVSGRNNLSFQQRVAIDRKYITRWSFGKDIAIIFRTFRVLVTGHGAC